MMRKYLRSLPIMLTLVLLGTHLDAQTPAPTPKAQAAPFKVCSGVYALCTTAKCTPPKAEDKQRKGKDKGPTSCECDVKAGPSVGGTSQKCDAVPQGPATPGMTIPSRYYPIKSYVPCNNAREWAWCLDKQCKINPDNKTAICACTLTTSKDTYIYITDKPGDSGCTTETISSATLKDSNAITQFLLETQLPAFPIVALPKK
jgi:hypothetical protein